MNIGIVRYSKVSMGNEPGKLSVGCQGTEHSFEPFLIDIGIYSYRDSSSFIDCTVEV